MKAYITTLGCPKNLVDTEASAGLLRGAGCTLTDDPGEAQILIVSACSFLEASWQETLEEVERLAEVKSADASKRLVLMGCLPKHRNLNLGDELPMVDRFLPSGAHGQLPALVREWMEHGEGAPVDAPAFDPFAGFESRMLLTPAHSAYVKIAEGCSRRCSFCAIPKIRGRMLSRTPDSVVREVANLRERGVKEVCLLAQDITSYRSQGHRFDQLVAAIVATGIEWVRIFYVHPGSLTLDLARSLFEHPAVCRYLESPVQHASDRILERMRRPYTRARLEKLFSGIRREFPDVRVRSEVIVGFPGEEEADFDELKQFVEAMAFSSLGVFTYSPEPNTPAAELGGVVPASVKIERATELSDLQGAVTFGLNSAQTGRVHRVLIDRRADEPQTGGYGFAGRYYGQAPEIDGEVMVRGVGVTVGEFVNARIVDADVFDLRAEVA
jgi:ribosomal protein S12 methylthiotransferase